jgi:hypothetical protein
MQPVLLLFFSRTFDHANDSLLKKTEIFMKLIIFKFSFKTISFFVTTDIGQGGPVAPGGVFQYNGHGMAA